MKKYFPGIRILFLLLVFFTLSGAKPVMVIGGRLYRHAGSVAREMGAGYFSSKTTLYLARGKEYFSFRPERADFRFANVAVAGSLPVRRYGKSCYISAIDVNSILRPLFQTGSSARRHSLRRIILDPGHGGFDRGASGKRIIEKRFVLNIAKRTAEILRKCGYEVILTRKSDFLVPLNQRSALANRYRGDIFVSLHCNSSTDRRAAGIETYCLTPAGAASTNQKKSINTFFPGNTFDANNFLLAFELQKSVLSRFKGADRGVRRGRFAVLRPLKMPGVLLEMGFLSNSAEEQKLLSPVWQEQICRAIAIGIINYHRRIYKIR